MLYANYTNKRGACCVCTVDRAKAEKLLKGGNNTLEVVIKTKDGVVVGRRWQNDDNTWNWFYDTSADTA